MAKLTKRIVESSQPEASDLFLWDDEVAGFGLRLRPSGRRSFIVQYRTREGRQRRRTLGRFPVMTVDQARRDAKEWLMGAQRGTDLAEAADRQRRAATVAELCERFIADHAARHKKPASAAEDQRVFATYVEPALGTRKAASVSHDDACVMRARSCRKP